MGAYLANRHQSPLSRLGALSPRAAYVGARRTIPGERRASSKELGHAGFAVEAQIVSRKTRLSALGDEMGRTGTPLRRRWRKGRNDGGVRMTSRRALCGLGRLALRPR